MRNLNEYNQENFQESFSRHTIAQAIARDFDMVVWDKHFDENNIPTIRQRLGARIFPMASWYYIEKLLEKNPATIHDFGCGWNLHKRYLPCIVGISPDNTEETYFGDEVDYFDEDFVGFHLGQYESAMAICSLNFQPLSKIRTVVEQFISIVKTGGRGYIALDLKPMIECEDPGMLDKIFGTADPIAPEIEDYVRSQLKNLPCKLLVYDIDSTEVLSNLDGHVRIVFERE